MATDLSKNVALIALCGKYVADMNAMARTVETLPTADPDSLISPTVTAYFGLEADLNPEEIAAIQAQEVDFLHYMTPEKLGKDCLTLNEAVAAVQLCMDHAVDFIKRNPDKKALYWRRFPQVKVERQFDRDCYAVRAACRFSLGPIKP